MKLSEQIAASDHIRFDAYTHAAYSRGDCVLIEGIGNCIVDGSNENEVANNPVTFNVGKLLSVFRTDTANVTGAPGVMKPLYIDSTGNFTMTDTSNTLEGVITSINGGVSYVKTGA